MALFTTTTHTDDVAEYIDQVLDRPGFINYLNALQVDGHDLVLDFLEELDEDFIDGGEDELKDIAKIFLDGIRFDDFNPTERDVYRFAANELIDRANEYFEAQEKGIDYSIFDKPIKGKGKRVGGFYEGVESFVEFENDNLYIPGSGYCLIKCLNKYYKLKGIDFEIQRNTFGPYNNSVKSITEYIRSNHKCDCKVVHSINCKNKNCKCKKDHSEECKDLREQQIQKLYLNSFTRMKNVNGKVNYKKTKGHIKYDEKDWRIILLHLGNNCYHSVLMKGKPDENWMANIKLSTDYELEIETTKLKRETTKKFVNQVYVYDIETYEKMVTETKKCLVPKALSFTLLDLKTGLYTEPKLIISKDNSNIYDDMLEEIHRETKETKIQIFAHNGGRFDHIYAKASKLVKITEVLGSGTSIKAMKLMYKNIEVQFKDSLPFLLDSLKKLGESFKVKNKKLDFDIIGKDEKFYDETEEWKEYVHTDVKCLAEVIFAAETEFRSLFSQSMTTSIGIPGVAWKFMMNTCLGLQKCVVPKSPSLIQFIRSSTYGGRVLHYKKFFNQNDHILANGKKDTLICLDGNSLYPSAMYQFCFPLGEMKMIESKDHFNVIKDNNMYIAEVTVKLPNVKYPYWPYREKLGKPLIYPIGTITGVYTSVDLQEMLIDGAELIEFKKGFYWSEQSRIFTEMIESLYSQRDKIKAESERTGIYDPREYIIKILINSQYGKFLEIIKDSMNYTDKGTWGKNGSGNPKFSMKNHQVMNATQLPNGQTEYKYHLDNPIVKKPNYIGSFILSYSRKIMNNLIRALGPENIYYGDTDAVYTKTSIYEQALKKYPQLFSSGLTGCKNDYGKTKFITKAIFADYKRYYLDIFDTKTKEQSIKVKFVGLKWKEIENEIVKKVRTASPDLANANEKITEEIRKMITENFLELMEEKKDSNGKLISISKINDKWIRSGLAVEIDTKILNFVVNPNKRALWLPACEHDIYKCEYNPMIMIDNKLQKIQVQYRVPKVHKSLIDYEKLMKETKSCKYITEYDNKKMKIKSQLPLSFNKDLNITKKEIETNFLRSGDDVYFIDQSEYKDTEIYTTNNGLIHQPVDQEKMDELLEIKEKMQYIITIASKDMFIKNAIKDPEFNKLYLKIKAIIKN